MRRRVRSASVSAWTWCGSRSDGHSVLVEGPAIRPARKCVPRSAAGSGRSPGSVASMTASSCRDRAAVIVAPGCRARALASRPRRRSSSFRTATPGCCSNTISGANRAVDAIHERPVVVLRGVDHRLQHFRKRKSGIETVRSSLQIERRIQRTQPGENRQRRVAEAVAELSNLGRGRDSLFLQARDRRNVTNEPQDQSR